MDSLQSLQRFIFDFFPRSTNLRVLHIERNFAHILHGRVGAGVRIYNSGQAYMGLWEKLRKNFVKVS